MSRLKNNSRFNRELIATVRALAQTNASLRDFIKLAASRTAARADWAIEAQNPFPTEEGREFVMKVRLRGG